MASGEDGENSANAVPRVTQELNSEQEHAKVESTVDELVQGKTDSHEFVIPMLNAQVKVITTYFE